MSEGDLHTQRERERDRERRHIIKKHVFVQFYLSPKWVCFSRGKGCLISETHTDLSNNAIIFYERNSNM